MFEVLRTHLEKVIKLTDEEFEFVAKHFTIRNFKRRNFIIQKGDRVEHSYFVISGLLMLAYTDESAKQHIVSFAMEDWWETDFLAYHSQTKATMSLQCLEDTQVLCLSLQGYKQLCASSHKMEHFFLEKANGGHIGSQQRILSFLTSGAKDRYEQLLKRYPSLLQRVPKTLIASYLGVSRETLSRLYN